MRSLNLLDDADLDLGGLGDLNLDGLTVTHMRDVAAMRHVGDGPMAFPSCITSSCSTSCCSVTE